MTWLRVDKQSKIPIIRQLYEDIRLKILKGELQAGYKLPSSRGLASSLQISRNVVLESYEMLAAEGYILGQQGSGMYVGQNACFNGYTEIKAEKEDNKKTTGNETEDIINFRSGLPALDMFPMKKWSGLYHQVCTEMPSSELSYGDPAGCLKLRSVIAQYLFKIRGVNCNPENIIITTGAVQALQLTAKLLTTPGASVILEDPSNYDLQRILSSCGAELIPIPVDEQGMKTELLPEETHPKMVYLTPSHQFPLGGILPIQRRIELIRYARKTGAMIVEDDYDSEFRYEGPPVSSLQSLDPDRVIYIGTFSKIMFPALRVGYMVLPEHLVNRCRKLKRHSDFQTPILEQRTLSAFIEGGFLERHVAKMKKVYYRRQKKLIHALEACFKNQFKVLGASTGLHVVVKFKFEITRDQINRLKKSGVRMFPVEVHAMNQGDNLNSFILGYGNLSEEMIDEGIKRMKKAFDTKI
ncbi:MAG: PLP-dependent aminotransferase family protein [Clostridia bacterium]|nr:PLP-dependent aminotransferase family protein [Clostridia bacterium]